MRNKPLRLSVFFILSCVFLISCSKKTREQGDKAYGVKAYDEAANIYKDVLKSVPKDEKATLAFRIAECYRLNYKYKEATRYYTIVENDKLATKEQKMEAMKKRGDMLKRQELYPDAITVYNQYLKDEPSDTTARMMLEGAELALKWMQSQECILFRVENLKVVNSNQSDYCAAPVKKEAIFLTSDRQPGYNKKGTYAWTGTGYQDLWVANVKKSRGELTIGKPELIKGAANSNWNEGTPAFDSKGGTMYFTKCSGKDGKLVTCQIYMSSKVGKDEWSEPQILDFCDTSNTYGHPTLSADGKTIYFSSDMPGGYGGMDIWMVNAVGRNKGWSTPLNLGSTINTTMDEMFPTITADGLYFSSNGHVGMGSLDMFKTTGAGNEWSAPENLKYPLNSGGDDFALVYKPDDNTSGYFSSNRAGGRGKDDIYEFFPIPQTFKITGVVKDCNTGLPIEEAGVFISNDRDSNKLVLRTDKNGFYSLALSKETSYELYADKNEDFYIGSKTAVQSTKGLICSKELVQNFELCRLCLDCMFNVRGILYDLDSARIRPDAAKILDDSVVALMKRFPTVTIELGSHTDCRASAEYNRDLAQRRADSAVNYIISRGIDSARLVAKGYGEDSLFIKKCKCDLSDYAKICTEAEHQLNRRTTVRITGTNYMTPEMKRQREEQRRREDQLRQNQNPQQQKVLTPDERQKERERKKEEQEKKKKQKEEERKRKAEEKKKELERKKKEKEEERKNKRNNKGE